MTDTTRAPRERPEDDEVLIEKHPPVIHRSGRERPEDDAEFML